MHGGSFLRHQSYVALSKSLVSFSNVRSGHYINNPGSCRGEDFGLNNASGHPTSNNQNPRSDCVLGGRGGPPYDNQNRRIGYHVGERDGSPPDKQNSGGCDVVPFRRYAYEDPS